ncbi:MAG: NAD(P)/FAD-dependent oxidoreductase [Chloroflexi bacterium]|nr:NAD(P)/FAD-dependent oxidoreductase [Chloroflexota bacterium]MBP8059440.1 NAD(P)/FAD-dependent oxidoreductase [Chloroflexota bacterium]
MSEFDAVIVGSGPNGLAAAITLAREGWRVLMLEGKETIGGGMRSAELTLPGFIHDICSSIHPLGLGSPFFRSLPLAELGLAWVHPTIPLAHPFDDGSAAALHRSIAETADSLGQDAAAYQHLMTPLVRDWEKLMHEFLGPLRPPRYPFAMARFGLNALWPAKTLAEWRFRDEKARGFFAGLAAHSIMPLDWLTTSAFGLMLGILGHAVGWPMPQGGTQQIANTLARYLESLGGRVETGTMVRSLRELPPAKAILLDVTPRQVLHIAGDELPPGYRRQLRNYRYGQGVFKIDYALSEPIPWHAAACRQAGTVHIGPTLAEIAQGEKAIWQGQHPERPYVLVAQHSLFDPTRAPAGQQTAWVYCHVPNGSTTDMTQVIENQIERFAPGFRDCILARHTMTSHEYHHYNPNYVGGDINGGVQDWRQLFTRPVPRLNPYTTPLKNLYLCSSATPPGGGVHGMCGVFAAQATLNRNR